MFTPYTHGAYGNVDAVGSKESVGALNAIIYIGTAPVQNVADGAQYVNKPIVIRNIAEARKKLGYSENWDSFTLCEAMHAHFDLGAIGPLVMINVLDPAKHKADESGSTNLAPVNGRITLVNAENIILDSVSVTGKTKGTDYSVQYAAVSRLIYIDEMVPGSLGTEAVAVTYNSVDPAKVTADDVIGTTGDDGTHTGLYAIKNVYQLTGYIPSFVLAPGFSSLPEVHRAMVDNCNKINGHWDAFMFSDIPVVTGNGESVTMAGANAWKNANGYNMPNEKTFFPLVKGTDGKVYHISVLAAANFQKLLYQNNGIPYMSASNTECTIISSLYFGEDAGEKLFDDEMINAALNQNGITSAAYIGGTWVIWGAHSADYSYSTGDRVNVSETNRMMLYYISNDFQHRRGRNVDTPITLNGIKTIVSEEQTRLDALVSIGALYSGVCSMDASPDALSDLMQGDLSFNFDITTTPLAKSLTANVNYVNGEFTIQYADQMAA